MIEVTQKEAVRVRVPQAVGQLARVLAPIAEARINTEALNTVTVNDEAILTLVTSDNRKAIDLWEKAGFFAEEVDLLAVNLPNKSGELAALASRLGQNGIDIRYAYAAHAGDQSMVYLATSNNQEAIRWIKG